MTFVGFFDKPKRFGFCQDCFIKWMGRSNNGDGGCPRQKIFAQAAKRGLDANTHREVGYGVAS